MSGLLGIKKIYLNDNYEKNNNSSTVIPNLDKSIKLNIENNNGFTI